MTQRTQDRCLLRQGWTWEAVALDRIHRQARQTVEAEWKVSAALITSLIEAAASQYRFADPPRAL